MIADSHGWMPPATRSQCADNKRQHVVNDQRSVVWHRENFRSSNCANCAAHVITHSRDGAHYLTGWYTPPVIQEEPW